MRLLHESSIDSTVFQNISARIPNCFLPKHSDSRPCTAVIRNTCETYCDRLSELFQINFINHFRFNVDDEDFFTSSIRLRIVDFILRWKRFKEELDDEFAFGIERLISEGIYSAAYPLHDVLNEQRILKSIKFLLKIVNMNREVIER